MTREILCTLGPASMKDEIITRLDELGVSLLRINLSHTALDDVAPAVEFIRRFTSVPICLDSEGAQVRTGRFAEPAVTFREGSTVRAYRNLVPGDSIGFNLYPLDIIDSLVVGDFISIDFNSVLVQVTGLTPEFAEMRIVNGGRVGNNKAVTIERDIALPALTDKDKAALAVGRDLGVKHFALSFAHNAENVREIRDIVGDDSFIISKIECLPGLRNLDEIATASDALLIDRGDLSRQVPLERIPAVQKHILARGKALNTKVYVATNLLESMVSEPAPSRAEVNDVFNTLQDGADGLVLAAETAIGAFPLRCASMIVKMIRQFEDGSAEDELPLSATSLLVPPHGGQLVNREADDDARRNVQDLPRIPVNSVDLMDCEQFALGTFSPLTGFMTEDQLNAVLDGNALPDGTPWTLPLVLQIDPERIAPFGPGDRVALTTDDDQIHSILEISDVYQPDMRAVAQKWFGTESEEHPGVARLLRGSDRFVGGAVTLIDRVSSPYRPYELTPQQTRFIFAHKGWSKVVGFHGRNPVHRAHEFIQVEALRRTHADGLYISPVIGPKKAHDFLPEPILKSYQLMLDFGCYPAGQVVLGSFATYSRYSGPREAVFTALCRKNMGCSHFIIGRDHTGVGAFYGEDANRRFFDELGDIGVAPVFFDTVGYNPKTGKYEEAGSAEDELVNISGTEVRESIRAGKHLPDWAIWTVVQDMLQAELRDGKTLFCD